MNRPKHQDGFVVQVTIQTSVGKPQTIERENWKIENLQSVLHYMARDLWLIMGRNKIGDKITDE